MKTLMLVCILGLGALTMNAQTRSVVNLDNLPQAISNDIANQHQGWNPLEAYKMDDKGQLKYEVLVKKADSEMKLVYDENGKFIESSPNKFSAGLSKSESGNCDKTSNDAGNTASSNTSGRISVYGTTDTQAQDTTRYSSGKKSDDGTSTTDSTRYSTGSKSDDGSTTKSGTDQSGDTQDQSK